MSEFALRGCPYKPRSSVCLLQVPGLSYTYEPLKLDPLDLDLRLDLDMGLHLDLELHLDLKLDPMDMELDLGIGPLTFSARPSCSSARAASRNARQSTV